MSRFLFLLVVSACGGSGAPSDGGAEDAADGGRIPTRPPPGIGDDAETSSCTQAGGTCNERACCPDAFCVDRDEFRVCASLCVEASDCTSQCCIPVPGEPIRVCAPRADCGLPEIPEGETCGDAVVTADNGQYLGAARSDPRIPEGVCNPNGQYGSPFGMNSMFNPNGLYGNATGDLSAQNPNAAHPPHLLCSDEQRTLGRVSKNNAVDGAIDPDDLCAHLSELGL